MSANRAYVDELVELIDAGVEIDFDAPIVFESSGNRFASYLDAHIVGSLLKRWFRDLPEPLCTIDMYDMWIAAISIKEPIVLIQQVKKVFNFLPVANRLIIRYLATFLRFLAKFSEVTRMTASNLAICFAPNLLRAPSTIGLADQIEESPMATRLLEIMIEEYEKLFFDAPPLPSKNFGKLPVGAPKASISSTQNAFETKPMTRENSGSIQPVPPKKPNLGLPVKSPSYGSALNSTSSENDQSAGAKPKIPLKSGSTLQAKNTTTTVGITNFNNLQMIPIGSQVKSSALPNGPPPPVTSPKPKSKRAAVCINPSDISSESSVDTTITTTNDTTTSSSLMARAPSKETLSASSDEVAAKPAGRAASSSMAPLLQTNAASTPPTVPPKPRAFNPKRATIAFGKPPVLDDMSTDGTQTSGIIVKSSSFASHHQAVSPGGIYLKPEQAIAGEITNTN